MLKVLLQDLDALPTSCLGVLSDAEQQTAAAMVHPHDARRQAAARAWLRTRLAEALAMPAQQVPLRRSATGKPEVDAPLAFNLSHSGRWAAMALLDQPAAQGCSGVGVDLETWSQATDLWAARDQFLHPEELNALTPMTPGQRDRLSLLCWTRKEAVLKAWGTGLLAPDIPPVSLNVGASTDLRFVAPGSPPGNRAACMVVSCFTQEVVLSVAWQGSAPLQVAWP